MGGQAAAAAGAGVAASLIGSWGLAGKVGHVGRWGGHLGRREWLGWILEPAKESS